MGIIPTKIRIISRPQGEAPEWVRDAWIGCELDCEPKGCGHVPQYSAGVLTGRVTKVAGYAVGQFRALTVLATKDRKAVSWWQEHGFPLDRQCFIFASTCAEVIESRDLRPGEQVVFCDDMETGTMRPMPH